MIEKYLALHEQVLGPLQPFRHGLHVVPEIDLSSYWVLRDVSLLV